MLVCSVVKIQEVKKTDNKPGIEINFSERTSSTALLVACYLSCNTDRPSEIKRIREAFCDVLKFLAFDI